MDLEKVERIMDDTADGIAYQKEIEETMTRDFTPEDEEEIMRELDRLVDLEVCFHACMPRPLLIFIHVSRWTNISRSCQVCRKTIK